MALYRAVSTLTTVPTTLSLLNLLAAQSSIRPLLAQNHRPHFFWRLSRQQFRSGHDDSLLHRAVHPGALRAAPLLAGLRLLQVLQKYSARAAAGHRVAARYRAASRFTTSATSSSGWSKPSPVSITRASCSTCRCSTTPPTKRRKSRAIAWSASPRKACPSLTSIAPIAKATRPARSKMD